MWLQYLPITILTHHLSLFLSSYDLENLFLALCKYVKRDSLKQLREVIEKDYLRLNQLEKWFFEKCDCSELEPFSKIDLEDPRYSREICRRFSQEKSIFSCYFRQSRSLSEYFIDEKRIEITPYLLLTIMICHPSLHRKIYIHFWDLTEFTKIKNLLMKNTDSILPFFEQQLKKEELENFISALEKSINDFVSMKYQNELKNFISALKGIK